MSNPPRFHDSDHPLFQSTDTFQQLIQDLNHFGDNVDSDMKYLDSAIGPETNSFRLTKVKGLEDFTANTLVDALNELDSDLHGAGGGNFKADTNTEYKTVTDAINEVERVFDASAGEILYPTGDPTETQTRLLISTAQSGGQRIDMKSGHDIILDAVNDIVVDAGGANITFKDDSAVRFDFQMGANQEIDVPTGKLTIDVADDIILDAGGADIDMQVATVSRVKHSLGATNTVTVNGNYTLDVSGDITLDAAGTDVIVKDGTNERFRFNADAAPNMTMTGTAASITNTLGDFTINAYESFVLNTNNASKSWDIDTDTITHVGDVILDVSNDIVLDAGGANITYKVNTTDRIAYTLGATNTAAVTGNYTLDVSGDIVLDADDATITMKDGGAVRFNFIMGADQEIDIPTGSVTFDVADDIILDADGGNIVLQDGGTTRVNIDYSGVTNIIDATGLLELKSNNNFVEVTATGGDILFNDGGATRFTWDMGATNTVTVDGNYHLTNNGYIWLDAGNGALEFRDNNVTTISWTLDPAATTTAAVTGGFTITSTADVLLDATGDITLDADGNQIRFKNGAGGDEVTHNLNDDASYEIDAPSHYTVDAGGDITLDADGGDWYFKDGGVNQFHFSATDGTLYRYGGNLTLDAPVGDIILDAEDNSIIFKNGSGGDQVEHLLADNGDLAVIYPNNISHTNTAGNLTFDIAGDITLDADGADIFFKDNGTTRIQHTMGATNTVAVTGNYTLDVSGDIVLDADGGDIDLKDGGTTRFAYGLGATNTLDITGGLTQTSGNYENTITGTRTVNVSSGHTDSASSRTINTTNAVAINAGTTANYTSGGATTIASGGITTIDAEGDITLDANGADIFFKDNGVTKFTFNLNGTPEIDVVTGLILDVEGDITLDANGADVLLADNAVQYGALTNTAGGGNLIIKSGTTTAMTFSGANVTVAGSITMPSSGGSSPITTAKTVHGALADINSRIPNIYDNNGTLLNPLP